MRRPWHPLGPAFIAFITMMVVVAWCGLAQASDGTTMANGTSQSLNFFSACKAVTNNSGQSLYIPTTSSGEWSSFYGTTHTGVSIAACSCALPWGGNLTDGSSVTAYSSATPSGASCASVSQTRTCTGTSLSGSYTNGSCSSGCAGQSVSWSSCAGTSSALAHGGSVSVSNTNGGYTGSVTVTCTAGSLSQSSPSCTGACKAVNVACSSDAECCSGLCFTFCR